MFTTTPDAVAEPEPLAPLEGDVDAPVDATGAVVGDVVAAGDEQAAASRAIATTPPKPDIARRLVDADMAFSQIVDRRQSVRELIARNFNYARWWITGFRRLAMSRRDGAATAPPIYFR